MTTEEKARAYDEALKKMRPLYEQAKKDDNPIWSTYEYLFPQIQESENERIRKFLIDYFHVIGSTCSDGMWKGFSLNDIYSWLENQKEQKSLNISAASEWLRKNVCHYMNSEYNEFHKCVEYDGSIDKERLINDFEEAMQKEQKPAMIQWTGKNLKEVIDFTGKSQKFGEWFKSWEDFENYVHSHDDILKLFCEDGSHYEVPVGAWIVKTPDGYNIPSRFRFIQKPAEWSYPYGKNETVDRLVSIAECLEMDGDCVYNGYKGDECGVFLRALAREYLCIEELVNVVQDKNLMDTLYFASSANHFPSLRKLHTLLTSYNEKKEQKPIKIEVYEIGKGTTVCGQDYKCKKDFKEGNCWYVKDVIYHCSKDGFLNDQNGVSWSCTPEWFNENIYTNNEWADKEKNDFVSGQFLQCKLSFDGLKKGEHYWLEYIGDDMYVGRSDNILNWKFHITPKQLYTLFSQQLEEKQKEQQVMGWTEKDDKMLNMIEYRLKDWDSIKEQQGYQVDYSLQSPIKWIKSLPDRFQLCHRQKDDECISPEEGDIVVNKYGEISVFESWGHHPDGGSFNDKSYFFAKCTLVGDNYDDFDCHPDSDGLRYATPEEIRKIVPYLLNEKV